MIGNRIKGLGEVVLRVTDLELMKNFYQNIIGLELMREANDFVFFKIADGYKGHTQVLALFDTSNLTAFGKKLNSIEVNHTNLYHIALEIDKSDYEEVLTYFENENVEIVTNVFEWVKWKSIFIKDPESNIIEFVCYDSEVVK
ncbi:MAG: VOC family protein [Melioribacteraceae bacterium]